MRRMKPPAAELAWPLDYLHGGPVATDKCNAREAQAARDRDRQQSEIPQPTSTGATQSSRPSTRKTKSSSMPTNTPWRRGLLILAVLSSLLIGWYFERPQ
jgi:hypothetical protein